MKQPKTRSQRAKQSDPPSTNPKSTQISVLDHPSKPRAQVTQTHILHQIRKHQINKTNPTTESHQNKDQPPKHPNRRNQKTEPEPNPTKEVNPQSEIKTTKTKKPVNQETKPPVLTGSNHKSTNPQIHNHKPSKPRHQIQGAKQSTTTNTNPKYTKSPYYANPNKVKSKLYKPNQQPNIITQGTNHNKAKSNQRKLTQKTKPTKIANQPQQLKLHQNTQTHTTTMKQIKFSRQASQRAITQTKRKAQAQSAQKVNPLKSTNAIKVLVKTTQKYTHHQQKKQVTRNHNTKRHPTKSKQTHPKAKHNQIKCNQQQVPENPAKCQTQNINLI